MPEKARVEVWFPETKVSLEELINVAHSVTKLAELPSRSNIDVRYIFVHTNHDGRILSYKVRDFISGCESQIRDYTPKDVENL